MTETVRGRVEQIILSNLADIHHGHENIPYDDQRAAAILSETIVEEGRNPWKLRSDGGVIELDGGAWVEVDELLTADACKEIENHPDIDMEDLR